MPVLVIFATVFLSVVTTLLVAIATAPTEGFLGSDRQIAISFIASVGSGFLVAASGIVLTAAMIGP